MLQVKVAEFRNKLSSYLKRVRRGAEIVITDRDTPIGRLIPYGSDVEEPFEIIPPPKGYGGLAKIKFSPGNKVEGIVEELLAERRKR